MKHCALALLVALAAACAQAADHCDMFGKISEEHASCCKCVQPVADVHLPTVPIPEDRRLVRKRIDMAGMMRKCVGGSMDSLAESGECDAACGQLNVKDVVNAYCNLALHKRGQ